MKKRIIAVELTNKCNLKCGHCPQGKINVPYGFMTEDTFTKTIKHCYGYTELNWRGEPLLHPRLTDFIKIAKQVNNNLDLGLHTNALLISEAKFYEIADSGLNWMHISLHTEESCKQYLKMLEWNEQLNRKLQLYSEVDTTQEELIAQINGFKENMYRKSTPANWGGFLTDYKRINRDSRAYYEKCSFVTDDFFIATWDGYVNGCCWDFGQAHNLGSIDDFDLIEHRGPYKLCESCIWMTINA